MPSLVLFLRGRVAILDHDADLRLMGEQELRRLEPVLARLTVGDADERAPSTDSRSDITACRQSHTVPFLFPLWAGPIFFDRCQCWRNGLDVRSCRFCLDQGV